MRRILLGDDDNFDRHLGTTLISSHRSGDHAQGALILVEDDTFEKSHATNGPDLEVRPCGRRDLGNELEREGKRENRSTVDAMVVQIAIDARVERPLRLDA